MASEVKKYPFIKEFETSLALALATSPRVFDALGRAIDPDRMPSDTAKLIAQAAKDIARAHGVPSASRVILVQHIRGLVDAGRITFERMRAAETLLTVAEDIGAADDTQAIIAEATPVLKKFAQQAAIEAVLSDFAKTADPSKAADRFSEVASIGIVREENSETLAKSAEEFDALMAEENDLRLGSGIVEVDNMLRGGLEQKALGIIVGPTGVGKSMFLIQIAAEALMNGLPVAYLTLELPTKSVKRRLYANLLNMTIEESRHDPAEANRRRDYIEKKIAPFEVCYKTAHATTTADVSRWLKERERDAGFKPKVIIVDMGDHLVSRVNSQQPSYEEMRVVYGDLRSLAVERDGWVWTCSHVKGGNDGKKRIHADQLSDSQHKSRTADLILSVNATDEDKTDNMVRFSVPKRRNDESNGDVGPLPRDDARGRIVCLTRRLPWG